MITAGKKVSEKITYVQRSYAVQSKADGRMRQARDYEAVFPYAFSATYRIHYCVNSRDCEIAQPFIRGIVLLPASSHTLSLIWVQHAWTTLSTMGSFSHFIALANAFDRIEAEAEAKLADGAEPISIAS